MQKNEILRLLQKSHQDLFDWLDKNGDRYWEYGPEGKWTTGQQVIHLIQSEKPLHKALRVPKFLLRYKFGRPNREGRSYDEVITRYKDRLEQNKEVVSPFSQDMPLPLLADMQKTVDILRSQVAKINTTIQKRWTEEKLDAYLLPHPLMGKMLVREILMWSAFHTRHHYQQIVRRAENNIHQSAP